MKAALLFVSHSAILALGFALGIYALPIITAPKAPSDEQVQSMMGDVRYQARFEKDSRGSDLFHWGEGDISLSKTTATFMGKLSPGPDYKLYLTKTFIETREDFMKHKAEARQLGDVKTFENFVVPIPADVDINQYQGILVWCESFEQFITSARYMDATPLK